MQITTKKAAHDLQTASLFKPVNGHTLNVRKFDSGKYEWTGRASDYVGRDVRDVPGVHAVYVERRADENGPYAQLMCVTER